MIIRQEDLIKQIAEHRTNIPISAIREVFKSAEDAVFSCLSSATASETVTIKLLDGLSLECSYIPEKQIHTYDDILCKSRIRAKAKVTRYYNKKLNGFLNK